MDIKVTLSDDPMEALREVASYLRTMNMRRERAVREVAPTAEGPSLVLYARSDTDPDIIGYYQLTGWLEGLEEIAGECDRIIAGQESVK